MDAGKVQLIQQSFGRCLLNSTLPIGFLDAFYKEFLASDPRIKRLFAQTDMAKQKDLLTRGLVMLIMYGNGSGLAKTCVEQLAHKHDRNHLNIDPGMYPLWIKCLLACVQNYDPQYDLALHRLWAEVLELGIRVMKKAY